MYTCNNCKSLRIKTRSSKSFGKSTSTAVKCKDCGGTDIDNLSPKNRRFRRR